MPILNILSLLTKAVTIQRPEQASQTSALGDIDIY